MTTFERVQLEHGLLIHSFSVPVTYSSSIRALAFSFSTESVEPHSAIELHAAFIRHCVDFGRSEDVLAVFDSFCLTYAAATSDIHVVVWTHGLDEAAARCVLKGYFSAWSIVNNHGTWPTASTPALFASDSVGLMAMFGGQRGTSNYLDEAEWLFDVYRPLLSDYVSRMSAFLHRESQDKRVSFVYSKGLDVLTWLTTASTMPDELYLLSIPVCQPLVALIQLMHVMVLHKTLGVSPGDLAKRFKVAVGHSQGIGIAAAFSTLTDEQSFFDASERILGIHLLAGAFPQIKFPCYQVLSEPNSSSESRPMVSVQGITKPVLERFIARFNIHQSSATEYAYLAVVNTVDQFIAACKTSSSANFVAFLQSQSATPDKDQSRIPYPKRKPVISVQYTTISAPSNCTLLEAAAEEAYTMAVKKGWVFRSEDMQIAVRASDDGHDIRTESDLTQYLFSAICVLPVDWPQATRHPGVTHIVDFGPGGLSGFGFIAYKNIEGMGVPVICAGALVSRSSKPYLGSKADLFKADLADVTTAPNWLAEFGPKLARTAYDDQLHIDTPMSRVLGAPTVMVAGMTPTTANEEFVAAINSAGYHVELGGGAIFTEGDMERKIDNLVKLAKPGQGITLNCIYMNQRMWSFQFPSLLRLRSQGVPIVGLCIGGGVPSLDSATAIIDSLRSVGIRHVSFKPSTVESIQHVVNIAKAHSKFPIVLQWTGGRAGGHHSFEDFHQPILETY
ncbi:fatty acid synthase alpha subunit Lsd1, partial [Coemansia sp. IMI 209128]